MVIPGNFAAIDLGSNTFHLIIFKDHGEDAQIVFKYRKAVGIGKKGLESQIITNDAIERALDALKEFKKHTLQHSCKQVVITATSAFRNATNGKEVVKKIFDETGFEVQIISGDEEAQLIYEGVKKSIKFGDTNYLIMDIGGGSVEFIICNRENMLWKESFEIGGIRLMERFHRNDPISNQEIKDLDNFLNNNLQSLYEACEKFSPTVLLGASGTFDTLCEIRNEIKTVEDSNHLNLNEFKDILNDIVSKDLSNRLIIPGMIAMRAEMISVSCLLIENVIKNCNIVEILCSQYALKEGLMYRILKNNYSQQKNK